MPKPGWSGPPAGALRIPSHKADFSVPIERSSPGRVPNASISNGRAGRCHGTHPPSILRIRGSLSRAFDLFQITKSRIALSDGTVPLEFALHLSLLIHVKSMGGKAHEQFAT
jgi:hypothetical protein